MFENFDIWNFLSGAIAGGLGGAFLTLKITKRTLQTTGTGTTVDQSGAKAGGDIVGRDKSS